VGLVLKAKRYSSVNKSSHSYGMHLSYGITQCYLPPDTSEHTPPGHPNPNQTGQYWIYISRRDGRLSWLRWLVTYPDSLPICRRSPIQVLTGPSVH